MSDASRPTDARPRKSSRSAGSGGSSGASSGRSGSGRSGKVVGPALLPLGPHAGKPAIPLTRPVTLVGSRNSARIHLVSRTVSKAHALVVLTGGGAFVRDLCSREGTKINGEKHVEHDLADGDKLQVGRFVFKFVAGRPREQARPARPAVLEVAGADLPLALERRTLLIGRRRSVDVPLLEESVSTAHAVVVERDGRRYVHDLGSRTGTFVNGIKVHSAELSVGDDLTIGETAMRLVRAGVGPSPASVIVTPAPSRRPEVGDEPRESARPAARLATSPDDRATEVGAEDGTEFEPQGDADLDVELAADHEVPAGTLGLAPDAPATDLEDYLLAAAAEVDQPSPDDGVDERDAADDLAAVGEGAEGEAIDLAADPFAEPAGEATASAESADLPEFEELPDFDNLLGVGEGRDEASGAAAVVDEAAPPETDSADDSVPLADDALIGLEADRAVADRPSGVRERSNAEPRDATSAASDAASDAASEPDSAPLADDTAADDARPSDAPSESEKPRRGWRRSTLDADVPASPTAAEAPPSELAAPEGLTPEPIPAPAERPASEEAVAADDVAPDMTAREELAPELAASVPLVAESIGPSPEPIAPEPTAPEAISSEPTVLEPKVPEPARFVEATPSAPESAAPELSEAKPAVERRGAGERRKRASAKTKTGGAKKTKAKATPSAAPDVAEGADDRGGADDGAADVAATDSDVGASDAESTGTKPKRKRAGKKAGMKSRRSKKSDSESQSAEAGEATDEAEPVPSLDLTPHAADSADVDDSADVADSDAADARPLTARRKRGRRKADREREGAEAVGVEAVVTGPGHGGPDEVAAPPARADELVVEPDGDEAPLPVSRDETSDETPARVDSSDDAESAADPESLLGRGASPANHLDPTGAPDVPLSDEGDATQSTGDAGAEGGPRSLLERGSSPASHLDPTDAADVPLADEQAEIASPSAEASAEPPSGDAEPAAPDGTVPLAADEVDLEPERPDADAPVAPIEPAADPVVADELTGGESPDAESTPEVPAEITEERPEERPEERVCAGTAEGSRREAGDEPANDESDEGYAASFSYPASAGANLDFHLDGPLAVDLLDAALDGDFEEAEEADRRAGLVAERPQADPAPGDPAPGSADLREPSELDDRPETSGRPDAGGAAAAYPHPSGVGGAAAGDEFSLDADADRLAAELAPHGDFAGLDPSAPVEPNAEADAVSGEDSAESRDAAPAGFADFPSGSVDVFGPPSVAGRAAGTPGEIGLGDGPVPTESRGGHSGNGRDEANRGESNRGDAALDEALAGGPDAQAGGLSVPPRGGRRPRRVGFGRGVVPASPFALSGGFSGAPERPAAPDPAGRTDVAEGRAGNGTAGRRPSPRDGDDLGNGFGANGDRGEVSDRGGVADGDLVDVESDEDAASPESTATGFRPTEIDADEFAADTAATDGSDAQEFERGEYDPDASGGGGVAAPPAVRRETHREDRVAARVAVGSDPLAHLAELPPPPDVRALGRRRVWTVPLLVLVMVGLIGALAWGVAAYVPVPATVTVPLRFDGLDRLSERDRRLFQRDQLTRLASVSVRERAVDLFRANAATIGQLGLLEPADYDAFVRSVADGSDAGFTADAPDALRLRHSGDDEAGDRARLLAVAQSLFEADRDLRNAAVGAAGDVERVEADVRSREDELARLDRDIADARAQGEAAPDARELDDLRARVGQLDAAWTAAAGAQKQAEVALQRVRQAAPGEGDDATAGGAGGAAGSEDPDAKVQEMQRGLDDLHQQIERRKRDQAQRADEAAKAGAALDAEIERFRETIARAKPASGGSPELAAYVGSADNLLASFRSLTEAYAQRSEQTARQLATLRDRMSEQGAARRAASWAGDPRLRELNEKLADASRRYNVAVDVGLPDDVKRYGQDKAMLEALIKAQQAAIGQDPATEQTVEEIQRMIDVNEQRMTADRRQNDELLESLQKDFLSARPSAESASGPQQELAKALEAQLVVISDAQQAYGLAVAGASDGSDEATRALQAQAADLQARMDAARERTAAGWRQGIGAEREAQRTAEIEEAQGALAKATDAEREAQRAYTALFRQLKGAESAVAGSADAGDRLQQLQSRREDVARELAAVRRQQPDLESRLASAVRPIEPTANDVVAVTGPDRRPMIGGVGAGAIVAVFLGLIAWTLHRQNYGPPAYRPDYAV